ncbi:hypothetical protein LZD49_00130 [Dyadobacter sp. CY261]|uniref:hypothetical protein n=1 Tax=Dyadobacter sp. CY261 TaxID=2907203 RepID=UPI001F24ACD9|nr:hypothetical protein [Dyadobacter sp. CY261]MCF0068853.1 hypothetical protein [Dyadobacter sp. CY261]
MRKLNLLLMGLVIISACSKKGKDQDPGFQSVKGFGASTDRPEGVPFVWPKGIRLLEKPGEYEECFDAIHKQNRNYGHGGEVQLCLNFYNETDESIKLTLPPGLMFISKSLEAQNGILVTAVTIEVPAGQYVVNLMLSCVNGSRSSSTGYEYEEQPIVTDHPALRDLVKMLKNKKCNYEDYGGVALQPRAMEISAFIDVAIKDLIKGKPIHQQEMKGLLAIPDR